jgi:hypothetical protein
VGNVYLQCFLQFFTFCFPLQPWNQAVPAATKYLQTRGTPAKQDKWRSLPKVPHQLQYVTSENHFGKVKINDTMIWKGLQTTCNVPSRMSRQIKLTIPKGAALNLYSHRM